MKKSDFAVILIVLLVVPFITGWVLGYEMMDGQIRHIPTAVMDHDNSEFSRTLVRYIEENETFDITVNPLSDQEIENRMLKGEIYVGVIIPEGLSEDILSGNAVNILTLYDGSSMLTVSSAKEAFSQIVMTLKAAYMINIYEGKQGVPESEAVKMAVPLDVTYRMLYNPTNNYRSYLLPGLLASVIQVGIVITGHWLSGKRNGSYLTDLLHIALGGAGGTIAITICIGIQHVFFDLPFRSSMPAFFTMTALFALCMTGFGYIFGSVINERVLSLQLGCLCVLPASILGGYTFPLMAMPEFFQKLSMLIPLSNYGDGLRNMILKPLDLAHLQSNINYFLLYLGAELLIVFAVHSLKKYRLLSRLVDYDEIEITGDEEVDYEKA